MASLQAPAFEGPSLKVTVGDPDPPHHTNRSFVIGAAVLQVVLFFLYGFCTDYDQEALPTGTTVNQNVRQFYGVFQDVHVMIFIGFGFLMTFLRRYAWSSLGFNFFIAVLAIQVSIIINGFFHRLFDDEGWHAIHLSIETLIAGDFAAATVLISFGALLGKATPLHLLVLLVAELVFYALNESLGVIVYEAVDMGGSMFVHTFGAYFGMAAAWALGRSATPDAKANEKSVYHSDITASLGMLFLWMFWPSFNGALAPGNSQERVIVNTLLSLTASGVSAVLLSMWHGGGKMSMVHFQNGVLAGGVAVGSSADLVIGPHGALIVGSVAGAVSVLGYIYVSPFLTTRFNLHDTCGVHNLHGLPGIIGGLGGVISAASAGSSAYGDAIGDIFPARDGSDPRSASRQAWFQLAALVTTLGISIGGGLLTGSLLKRLDKKAKEMEDEDWQEDEMDP